MHSVRLPFSKLILQITLKESSTKKFRFLLKYPALPCFEIMLVVDPLVFLLFNRIYLDFLLLDPDVPGLQVVEGLAGL